MSFRNIPQPTHGFRDRWPHNLQFAVNDDDMTLTMVIFGGTGTGTVAMSERMSLSAFEYHELTERNHLSMPRTIKIFQWVETLSLSLPQGSAKHPCPFSGPIMSEIRTQLHKFQITHVHDPFAGEGLRLEQVAYDLGITFTGTELEPAFIRSRHVSQGDATDSKTYPEAPYAISTSPVYPNGMADSHDATDDSKRNTYRAAVGLPLAPTNMGAQGYRGTMRSGRSKRRRTYWRLARRTIENWSGATHAFVNTSDFVYSRKGKTYTEPVTLDWVNLMRDNDWTILNVIEIPTQRQRYGANGDKRVDHEDLIVAKRTYHPDRV